MLFSFYGWRSAHPCVLHVVSRHHSQCKGRQIELKEDTEVTAFYQRRDVTAWVWFFAPLCQNSVHRSTSESVLMRVICTHCCVAVVRAARCEPPSTRPSDPHRHRGTKRPVVMPAGIDLLPLVFWLSWVTPVPLTVQPTLLDRSGA